MKKKIPAPTQAEVKEAMTKDQTVQLRLSAVEKDATCPDTTLCVGGQESRLRVREDGD